MGSGFLALPSEKAGFAAADPAAETAFSRVAQQFFRHINALSLL
jgi:hypothetical protein